MTCPERPMLALLFASAFAVVSFSQDLKVNGSLFVKGPSPWVDVKAKGVVGDGVTDDTAAFQAAINAACQNTTTTTTYNTPAVSGGTVLIPSGTTILISGQIVVPKQCSGLTIRGATMEYFGPGVSAIKVKTGLTRFDALRVDGVSTVLDSFTLDCQSSLFGTGSCINGILVRGANHGWIHRVNITSATEDGILVINTPGAYAVNIASAVRTNNVVTITTQTPHEVSGQLVFTPVVNVFGTTGCGATDVSGSILSVTSVPSSTTLTYSQTGPNTTCTPNVGTLNWHGNTNTLVIDRVQTQYNGKHGVEIVSTGNTNGIKVRDILSVANRVGVLMGGLENVIDGGLYEANDWGIKISEANASVSTTISAAITTTGLQVVTPAALTNINAGTQLVVNTGLADQEFISVQCSNNVPSGVCARGTFQANFHRTHASGATLTYTPQYTAYVTDISVLNVGDYENAAPNCILPGGLVSFSNLIYNSGFAPLCAASQSQLVNSYGMTSLQLTAQNPEDGTYSGISLNEGGFLSSRSIKLIGSVAASLPTNEQVGSIRYCSDCTSPSNPCLGSGKGAIAIRQGSPAAWACK